MSLVTITKRFGRKISHDYQSYEFMTELTREVEINSKEDLLRESDKLAANVKALTEADIQKVSAQIKAQELPPK